MTKSDKAKRDYHLRCKREIFRGERPPAGPGEVFDLIAHKGFTLPQETADQLKSRWVSIDNVIHRNYSRRLGMNDQFPPCHTCPPMVVAYCEATGQECKAFTTWTTEGTRRLTMVQQESGMVRKTKNSDRTTARRDARKMKKAAEALAV